MNGRAPYRLVYLLGAGHSGSTLLDMLLGGHPDVMALGELSGVHRFWAMARGREPVGPRGPGDWVEVFSHPFGQPAWQEVVRCFEASGAGALDVLTLRHPNWLTALVRWSSRDVLAWARPNAALLDCWARMSGRQILTDASKRPQRLYLLARSGLFDLTVIHLMRDGRGVMYSYLKKYGPWGIAFRRWAGATLMSLYLRRYLRGTPWLDVRYEQLASDPGGTMRRICDFLGIPFVPAMLHYRSYKYAGLGGNRMREDADEHIALDDRWRQEWRGAGRLAFSLAGGWLNRLCGY